MKPFHTPRKKKARRNTVASGGSRLGPEEQLQALCVDWLKAQHPDVLYWHSPSENKFSGILRVFLKPDAFYKIMQGVYRKLNKLGFRRGIPDLELHWKPSSTAFVEFKNKGGTATQHQLAVIERLRAMGFPAEIVDDFEDFKDLCRSWKMPTRATR